MAALLHCRGMRRSFQELGRERGICLPDGNLPAMAAFAFCAGFHNWLKEFLMLQWVLSRILNINYSPAQFRLPICAAQRQHTTARLGA